MALRGIYHVNMDAKGRLALPAKIRERLAERQESMPQDGLMLVTTIDPQNKCLLVYPEPAWQRFESQLEKLPSLDPAVRRFQRLILGYASDLDVDSTGRVLLPAALREYAQLSKKTVVVGQAKRLEIWNEELWLAERDQSLEDVASGQLELSAELLSLSL